MIRFHEEFSLEMLSEMATRDRNRIKGFFVHLKVGNCRAVPSSAGFAAH